MTFNIIEKFLILTHGFISAWSHGLNGFNNNKILLINNNLLHDIMSVKERKDVTDEEMLY